MEHLDKIIANSVTADIAVKCPICEEYTPMNSHDGRARGVFICDKCRAAIMHLRNILENGGSIT
jgi:transposase-like protein